MFWDKVEKSIFESIINTVKEPLENRLAHHLSNPIQDGGQWDMFCSWLISTAAFPRACARHFIPALEYDEPPGVPELREMKMLRDGAKGRSWNCGK